MKEKTYVQDIERNIYDFKDEEKDAYRINAGLTPEIVEKLSKENQIIYDILRLSFATQLSAADDYLLAEPLGANLGIQAQLPVLLAEYTFSFS